MFKFHFLVSKFSFVVTFFDRSPHSYDVASCMDSYKVLKRTSATYSHSENETLLLQRSSLAIAAISHPQILFKKRGHKCCVSPAASSSWISCRMLKYGVSVLSLQEACILGSRVQSVCICA